MIHYSDFDVGQIVPRGTDKKTVDNIFTFDIETTSLFYKADKVQVFDYSKPPSYYEQMYKTALPYIWQMSVDGVAVYGRHLDEYISFVTKIREHMGRSIFVWVHNLPFEFQFLRYYHVWERVSAREPRKPYRAETQDGIIYRCTYALTNMSLYTLAKSFKTHHQKLVGDLDYNVLRTPYTDMTPQELAYCENDVFILHDYVSQLVTPLAKVPNTQTGFIRVAAKDAMGRKQCRENAIANETEIDSFRLLNRAYAGGYTHANANRAGMICSDVVSYDFSSSYPYCMLSEKYPSVSFLHIGAITQNDFDKFAREDDVCYVVDFTVFNYRTITQNSFISANKCIFLDGAVYDNGRIVSAAEMRVALTNVDIQYFLLTCKFDDMIINDYMLSYLRYLPQSLYDFILTQYSDKTRLKNVAGEDANYLRAKQFINSVYGMAVTNTVKPDTVYINDDWHCPAELTRDEMRQKLRENYCRGFMDYAWGVWVTAYARRNLWSAIYALDKYIIYCDTDSIKCDNVPAVAEFVKQYNQSVDDKLRAAARHYGQAYDYAPKDKKGTPHPLGYFEQDAVYKMFKTLGAKKYAYDNADGTGVHTTIAGVPKSFGGRLKNLSQFTDGLSFYPTPEYHKMIAHYDDKGAELTIDGKTFEIKSAVCLQPTGYVLSTPQAYKLLWEIRQGK